MPSTLGAEKLNWSSNQHHPYNLFIHLQGTLHSRFGHDQICLRHRRCGGDIADGVIAFEAARWRINFIHMHLKANI